MAKVAPTLSPNRALERMRRHDHAVIVLAMQCAKKSVLAQLRAQGLKPQDFSAHEISVQADLSLSVIALGSWLMLSSQLRHGRASRGIALMQISQQMQSNPQLVLPAKSLCRSQVLNRSEEVTMWVLILFYFSGGNPSVAMHDFATQAAREHASAAAQEVQRDLPGLGRIRGLCVPKG